MHIFPTTFLEIAVYGFYELSRVLMRKNVNDDFSKVIERFLCGMF